jgi:hypothetical protein
LWFKNKKISGKEVQDKRPGCKRSLKKHRRPLLYALAFKKYVGQVTSIKPTLFFG